jgi:hypothetical protein
MGVAISFNTTGNQTLNLEKTGQAKIVAKAFAAAGIPTTAVQTKTIDLNAPPKPLSDKQKAAIEKMKKARANKKK